MARANYVKSAQKDIYQFGKKVEYVSQKGKRSGQTLSKIDRTVPRDGKDLVYIAKGESYYWWQFKNSISKNISKSRPRNSQLTQSNYLSTLYGIQESMEDFSASEASEVAEFIDDIKGQLEELKDTTEESLNNMPEGLQQGSTGELLQERIDALDSAISELEEIDTDYEEPEEDDIIEELKDDVEYEPTEEEEMDSEFNIDEKKKELVSEEDIEQHKADKMQEWIDERIEEINGISLEG